MTESLPSGHLLPFWRGGSCSRCPVTSVLRSPSRGFMSSFSASFSLSQDLTESTFFWRYPEALPGREGAAHLLLPGGFVFPKWKQACCFQSKQLFGPAPALEGKRSVPNISARVLPAWPVFRFSRLRLKCLETLQLFFVFATRFLLGTRSGSLVPMNGPQSVLSVTLAPLPPPPQSEPFRLSQGRQGSSHLPNSAGLCAQGWAPWQRAGEAGRAQP